MSGNVFVPESSKPARANGYIESRPGVCGGKPCVAGTRIRVQDIALMTEFARRPTDEVLRDFPQLSLAQIHAALAYYFDHLEEIRRDIDESEKLAEIMKSKHGSPLEEKLASLRGKDATNDPLSPR